MPDLDFSHGGNIYAFKAEGKSSVLDFSASINPLGLPLAAKEMMLRRIDKVTHYPDPDAKGVTEAVSRHWRIPQENILVGNGSIELIYLITQAKRPKSATIAVPTFSEYERACRLVKSKISFICLKEKDGFCLAAKNIAKSDIFFLCNPNNPTGNLVCRDPLHIKNLRARLIVVDESFMDFLPDESRHSLLKEAVGSKNLIVIRSFTKFFAFAGLRIGYLVAHEDTILALKRYLIPWSVNTLAQFSAAEALADRRYQDKTRFFIEKERRYLSGEVGKIEGLHPYPSEANFILIRINDNELTSLLLAQRLIRSGILIRDCANFRGLNDKYFRVAVRSRPENLKLLGALRQIM